MTRPIFFIITVTIAMAFVLSSTIRTHAQTEPDTSGGKLIGLGFHKLFVREKGDRHAHVTIVFESGGGGSSNDWTKVIDRLPPEYHTIAYDRAGIGKSERGPIPRTIEQEVYELHKLLESVQVKGPIILVGQSLGGLLVRLYTDRYGKHVKGLVLIDPTHESGMLGSMKYGGWVRLREKALGKPIPKPQLKNRISHNYDSTADYLAEDFQNIYLTTVKKPQQLGNRPLIIIGAGIRKQPPGTPDEQWKQLRAERDKQVQDLTSLSGNSKFILDPGSSHHIQHDNPEMVANCIQMVITSIINNTKL
jgi:pimeloyl-ACP methyl ester carboxylesterase